MENLNTLDRGRGVMMMMMMVMAIKCGLKYYKMLYYF